MYKDYIFHFKHLLLYSVSICNFSYVNILYIITTWVLSLDFSRTVC